MQLLGACSSPFRSKYGLPPYISLPIPPQPLAPGLRLFSLLQQPTKKIALCRKDGLGISRRKTSLGRSKFLYYNRSKDCSIIRGMCQWRTLTEESTAEVFSGLGDVDSPILVCETETLPAVLSLPDARDSLLSALTALQTNSPRLASGVMRFQVALPLEIRALQWLQSQPQCPQLLPRLYFSSRGPRGEGFDQEDADIFKGVAGVGSAVHFKGLKSLTSKDWKSLTRFLSKDSPLIRAYGAIRFNAETVPSAEWDPFGSFYFFIPQIEFCEGPTCSLLAVTVAWDEALGRVFNKAVVIAKDALTLLSDQVSITIERPLLEILEKEHVPCEKEWHEILKRTLETLEYNEAKNVSVSEQLLMDPSLLDRMGLSKVVIARRTKLEADAVVEPLTLVAGLQEKDPDAYQFCIQASNRSAFIGSTCR